MVGLRATGPDQLFSVFLNGQLKCSHTLCLKCTLPSLTWYGIFLLNKLFLPQTHKPFLFASFAYPSTTSGLLRVTPDGSTLDTSRSEILDSTYSPFHPGFISGGKCLSISMLTHHQPGRQNKANHFMTPSCSCTIAPFLQTSVQQNSLTELTTYTVSISSSYTLYN